MQAPRNVVGPGPDAGVVSIVRLLYTTLRGLAGWGDVDGTTFHLALGVGRVDRDGEGYRRFTEIPDLTLAGGLGVTVPMGGILALRWDLEDYVSRARFQDRGLGEPVSLVRHDLAVSMSLVFRVVTF